MMNYSSIIKDEIRTINSNPCCLKTWIYSIILFKAYYIYKDNQLEVNCKNKKTLKTINDILFKVYNYQPKTLKNYLFISDNHILSDLKLINTEVFNYHILKKECCRKSVIRSLFYISGSINEPESSGYHLEIVLKHSAFIDVINSLLNPVGIFPKYIERTKGLVMYLKKAEQIGDFLKFMQVYKNLYKFEDLRIARDYNSCATRFLISNITK